MFPWWSKQVQVHTYQGCNKENTRIMFCTCFNMRLQTTVYTPCNQSHLNYWIYQSDISIVRTNISILLLCSQLSNILPHAIISNYQKIIKSICWLHANNNLIICFLIRRKNKLYNCSKDEEGNCKILRTDHEYQPLFSLFELILKT